MISAPSARLGPVGGVCLGGLPARVPGGTGPAGDNSAPDLPKFVAKVAAGRYRAGMRSVTGAPP